MTERELKDPTGKVVFRAVEYDGTSFPAIIFGNIANQLRELNKMTFKEGDVFNVAYPESGQFMLLFFYDYPVCTCTYIVDDVILRIICSS